MYEAWENMKLLLMVSGGAILWIVMVLVAVGLRNKKGGHRNE